METNAGYKFIVVEHDEEWGSTGYKVLENKEQFKGVDVDTDGVTFNYYDCSGEPKSYRVEYCGWGSKLIANELANWFIVRTTDSMGNSRYASGLDFLADGTICVAAYNAYFKSIHAAMTFIENMYDDYTIHLEDPITW